MNGGNRASAVPSLLRLPPELTTYIFSILLEVHPPSLNACTRVSRAMCDIAAPILYTRIRISPDRALDSRQDHSLERLAPKRQSAVAKGKPSPKTRKAKLVANARVIHIEAHPHTWCTGKELPSFPKLQTLVLTLAQTPELSLFHTTYQYNMSSSAAVSCKFIDSLRPRKLVLRNADLRTLQTKPSDLLLPPNICRKLEELTIYFSSQAKNNLASQPLANIWDLYMSSEPYQPRKTRKITCVFHTGAPEEFWDLTYTDNQTRKKALGLRPSFVEDISHFGFGRLVMTCPPDATVTYVNTGSISPKELELDFDAAYAYAAWTTYGLPPDAHHSCESVTEAFKEGIKKGVIRETLSDLKPSDNSGGTTGKSHAEQLKERKEQEEAAIKKIEEAFARVRWLDMKTYLKENGWAGEMSYQEARRWLEDD
ncbi:hypothetical protein IAU59_005138 [Kwoniella sp. CBS 9459]